MALTEANQGCSPFNVVLGLFDLLDTLMCFWGIFDRLPTPGKVHHCSMFSPFVDNGSHFDLLES